MALVRWLLEDLIITDTSKENVFELQENYPCCSRDMVMGSPARIKRNLTWEEKLGILENSKEYVSVAREMQEQGVL